MLFLRCAVLLLLVNRCQRADAQCPTNQQIYDSVRSIEGNDGLSSGQKLPILYALKKKYLDCGLIQDSAYARLLHRIGTCEFGANSGTATVSAILNTQEAARINAAGGRGSKGSFAVNSYMNLGYYYKSLRQYAKALAYFDTAIIFGRQFPGQTDFILSSRINKALILKDAGDYQKAIEECTLGILLSREVDSATMLLGFLNQRAICYYFEQEEKFARPDADSAIVYGRRLNHTFELASAYKMKSLIDWSPALFNEAVQLRLKTGDYGQVADDYIDLGNYYSHHGFLLEPAQAAYEKALLYARKAKDNEKIAKVYTNMGFVSFRRGRYGEALDSYSRALKYLLNEPDSLRFTDPGFTDLQPILNKDLVLWILANRIDASLHSFRKEGGRPDLDRALHTALLADSLLTAIRHEQTSEQSKLFWRERMREIFTNGLEACYLTGDPRLAFFFMESSRAALLNDKLQELGAQAHISSEDTRLEQQLVLNMVSAQLKAADLAPGKAGYDSAQSNFLHAKENVDRYIRSLENRYPAYYQYKYASAVPSLHDLQGYLAANKASFVDYYMTDTLLLILAIDPHAARLIRFGPRSFDHELVNSFLRQCSDEQYLNSHYDRFGVTSYQLYQTMFKPLGVPPGRVIVCPDNFQVPFEALCRDRAGGHYLVEDYLFSYVYSAKYLLAPQGAHSPTKNFIGFAPVFFQPYLHLPDLRQSDAALRNIAGYYSQASLFTLTQATKKKFLDEIPGYAVVNLFSHAQADTSDQEPLLFFQDSVIRLSELQLLPGMATRLVVLSACQTNVGKNATGEGVYSLARGFAAAGVPSVAATEWQAEDLATYAISTSFHHYLAAGFSKDSALQQAKLDYIREGGRERSLPYYWANMILVGNTNPIRLTGQSNSLWELLGGMVLFLALVGWMIARQSRQRHR
jgi:CHAT domain-containing protein